MYARALTRLAALLGVSGRRHPDPKYSQRLAAVRAAVAKWKERAAHLSARAEELATRVAALEAELRQLKQRSAVARRELLSVAVVQQTFAHRLRTLPARATLTAAAGREEQLLRVSAAYRRALQCQSPGPRVTRATLEGLTWWEPAGRGAASRETRPAEERRLPYHGILQTREVVSGGIMLDLGANVGRMAIPRVILGDVAIAYCAEPDPVTYACLARNVVDNGLRGLVLPDQTAIGDRNGTVPLLRTGASGSFHVVTGGGAPGEEVVEVPCCTLDAWVERLEIDLDAVTFVKVDVEGFERRVVAGGSRVLAHRHIAWQMEIKPAGLRAAGDEPARLYEDLRGAFGSFIDLNRRAAGKRVRPVAELAEALQYIEPGGKTDVLLFS
jgi:FkbM family methyltransferase